MTAVLLVLLSLLAFGLCILLGALVELFNQVQQIRTQLGMVDRATPLDLGAKRDALASTVGLPAVLDDTGDAMVLFLSNRCTTCRAIAHELDGTVPPAVCVAEPVTGDDQEAEAFLQEFRLDGGRALVDRQTQIAEQLDLNVTPSAIFIENGRLRRAQTVPSSRQLSAMLTVVK
jgi:hypothetical protein